MNERGSYRRYRRGGGIREVVEEAVIASRRAYDNTRLFIVGGGNSLRREGCEETVNVIIGGVKEIRRNNKELNTVVCGMKPRPKEDRIWKEERVRTNRRIEEEVVKMSEQGYKVSFLSLDPGLTDRRVFKDDGVHLNERGMQVFGRRLLSVVRRSNSGGSRSPPLSGRR